MKHDTPVMIGFRNVGAANETPIIESHTAIDGIKRLALLVNDSTMAKRIQIVVARNQEEVMVGLGLSKTNKEAKLLARAKELTDFTDSLFDAPAGAGISDEQTQPEDDKLIVSFPMLKKDSES